MTVLAAIGAASARLANLPAWVVGVVVGAIGAGAAWWYYEGSFEWWHLWAYLGIAGACLLIAWLGKTGGERRPLMAVQMMGARTLAAVLTAGLGSALLISVAIGVVPPGEEPSDQAKALYGAISAVVAAAITGSLIKVSESLDGPAASMAQAFLSSLSGELNRDSAGWKAVNVDGYGGKFGWGPAEREWRAQQVEASQPNPGRR